MRVYSGSGQDILAALVSILASGGTGIRNIDTGVRGSDCRRSKEWHLDQIALATEQMERNELSAEEGRDAIQTLTDCMAQSEREQAEGLNIHSTEEDQGVEDFLSDLFGRETVRRLGAGNETERKKRERMVEEANKLQSDIALEIGLLRLETGGGGKASPETVSKLPKLITRLNEMLVEIRRAAGTNAPADIVASVATLNRTIARLNSTPEFNGSIPSVLNPNDIPLNAPAPSGTSTESGEGDTRADLRSPASTDSRGEVQRVERGRRGTKPVLNETLKQTKDRLTRGAKKTAKRGVNPNRSRGQRLRWKKLKAAEVAAKKKKGAKKRK